MITSGLLALVFFILYIVQLQILYPYSDPWSDVADISMYLLAGALSGGLLRIINLKMNYLIEPKGRLLWGFLKLYLRNFLVIGAMTNGVLFGLTTLISASNYISLIEVHTTNVLLLLFVLAITLAQTGVHLFEKWRQSMADAEHYKQESIRASLETLKAQINPHFLFNSLNTLVALIHEDQEKAVEYTRQLSYCYRFVLENRDRDLIQLEEEKVFLGNYLSLLNMRFGNRLQVAMNMDMLSGQQLIMPFAIQMLIENAIKHNSSTSKHPLQITLEGEEIDGKSYLVVKNTVQKMVVEQQSTGFGLDSITKRYEYLTELPVIQQENAAYYIVKLPILNDD